ncbi:putative tetratricopeptide-like helical domain superfamily [Helianthus annuus]|nr:putative tetratricopeptide-like helical domain superfamily [Helianthus annuus]
MLHCIRHQCRSLIRRPLNPSTLISPIFSSLISSQTLQLEPQTTSLSPNASSPYGLLSIFKQLCGSRLKSDDGFGSMVSGLKCSEVDEVIDYLRMNDADSAVELFELLKNEYGFKHSRRSQFVIAHVLANRRRIKMLRSNFTQMVQEEGSGSGPSLCELLSVNFKCWNDNAIVWDMLAFAYSRSEMVHDALFVIAKMKDLNIQPSIMTYNSLLYNLRHSDIMWDVYNDIKESGIPESKQTKSILVDGLCKQSLMQEAVTLLHETDHVASFNTIMSSFSKMGFVDVAQSIFGLMLKFGVHPDAYSYNILINGLCLAGSIEDALKFTYDMDKHGVEPDATTYNTISKGFRVLGKINGALKSIQQMLTKGLTLNPNSITYTLLICGNCQAGKVDESLILRDEMLSRGYQLNYVSYSVLVSSLCKIGRVDEALFLLYEMEIVGLKPDDVMYSIIIHGLCKRGDLQRAIQVYIEMRTKTVFPNVFAQRAILLGLCGRGSLTEARMYFDMLTDNDGNRDIILYNIMIDKYAKLGMIDETLRLYNRIVEKAGQLTKAMRLFDNVRDHGLAPTAITYTTLMNFLCENGNIKEMFDLMREMEASDVEPTHVTYTVIIKGFCKQWKLEESMLVLDNMISLGVYPDEVSYNILIQRFCKARKIKQAFELHDEMVSRDLKPDGVTYNILINGLCVYGDVHDADKLFLYLRERNFVLKKAAYMTLVKAHCVKGDVNRATTVFSEMVKMGFDVTVRDYSCVVNRLCKRRLTNEAKVFLSMMFRNGVLPDVYVYTVLMDALRLVGDHRSIHELLANMVKCGCDDS